MDNNTPNRNKYTLATMRTLPVGSVIMYNQMSESRRISFESCDIDSADYNQRFNVQFDSFFVEVDSSGADYAQIWGMMGIVPCNGNPVTKVF